MAETELQEEWTQEGQNANTSNDPVSQQGDQSKDEGVLEEVVDNDPAFSMEKKIKDKLTGDE